MRIVFILFFLSIFSIFSTLAKADEYRVTVDNLNVRLLPGSFKESKVIARLKKGKVVIPSSSQLFSGWIHITLADGREGYVSSKFLENIRVDSFNADFLQLLPGSSLIKSQAIVSNYGLGGVYRRDKVAITQNGRFAAFYDDKLQLVDTKIGRITRTLDVRDFAMTNRFLVYNLNEVAEKLQVIDLHSTDKNQELNLDSYGLKAVNSVIPVTNSDVILVNGYGDFPNKVTSDLVFIDLATGEQKGSQINLETSKNDSVYSYRLKKLTNKVAIAYQSALHNEKKSSQLILIDLEHQLVISKLDLPKHFATISDIVVAPKNDYAILSLSIISENHDRSDLIAAIDLKQGRLTWEKRVDRLDVTETSKSLKDNKIVVKMSASEVYYLDASTGENLGRAPDFPYMKDGETITQSYKSNDGGTELNVSSTKGSRLHTVHDVYFSVKRDEKLIAHWVQAPANRSFIDLGKEGTKLRVLLDAPSSDDESTFFEWDLKSLKPVVKKVPKKVIWISEPATSGKRTIAWASDRRGSTDNAPNGSVNNVSNLSNLNMPLNKFGKFGCGRSKSVPEGEIFLMGPQAGFVSSIRGIVAFLGNECAAAIPDSEHPEYMLTQIDSFDELRRKNEVYNNCSYEKPIACASLFSSREHEWLDHEGKYIKVQFDGKSDVWVETYQLPIGNDVGQAITKIASFKMQNVADLFEPQNDSNVTLMPPSGNGNIRFLIDAERQGKKGLWAVEFTIDGKPVGKPLNLSDSSLIPIGKIHGRDGKYYAQKSSEGIKLWDAKLAEIKEIRLAKEATNSSEIRMGKDVLVFSVSPIEHRIYGLNDGEHRATFFLGHDGEAVVLTPAGFFSQNKQGAASSIIVRNRGNGDVVPLTAVFDELYRPDLVQEALNGDPKSLVKEASKGLNLATVIGTGSAPEVQKIDFDGDGSSGSVITRAQIQMNQGGFGQAIWRVNGVVVGVDENVSQENAQGNTREISRRLPVVSGNNEISLQLTNSENSVYSERIGNDLKVEKTVATDPQIYVLAIGVNEYEVDDLKLKYSVADAKAIADAFANRNAKFSDVIVHTLLDGQVTKAAIADKFLEISEAIEPDDTFIFYLAGHGITYNGRYFFLPPNVDAKDGIADAIKKYGISQNDWRAMLSGISALKALVIFDSCESGSAVRMDEANALEQGASIEKLSRSSGRAVMTAASENQYALEGYEGHGAFTYTLLQAFEKGDRDKNNRLKLSELADYVTEQLPKITEDKWSYRQEPKIVITGADFNIAEIE